MISLPFILLFACMQDVPTVHPEMRAAIKLGTKSAFVQNKLSVLNQVVLVPDEATYLDEISNWSTDARWPVLFNQEPFASTFIRKFKPEKIWIRNSVGLTPDNIGAAMQLAVAHAWDGDSSIELALLDLNLSPLGVVITAKNASSRTAAVALAAGRGQLLKYMSSDWGKSHTTLSEPRTGELLREVKRTLIETKLSYEEIGDSIDAITICMDLPARVTFSAARENPVAVSDVIGRDETGKRFAWTGWVFGSKATSAYTAMCSLFLERDNYWFCNTYPSKGSWALYGLGNILTILPEFGINGVAIHGQLSSLQEAETGGVTTDLVFFTTKGNADFLDMSDQRTSPNWLPILNTPAALYFVHSWSLKNPTAWSTVGGTWLSRGIYAYVGSSHEPMLQAFVPPTEVLQRTMSIVPFLLASRWQQGENIYAKPWRVNTIGDPLMLCPPKGTIQRTLKPATKENYYQDSSVKAREAMEQTITSPSDQTFADAIALVTLVGRDELAIQLWSVALQQGVANAASASASLPSLFREQKVDDFLWAVGLIDELTRLEKDMLWHLIGTKSNVSLQLLVKNLRHPYQLDDLTVIADRIAKTKGTHALRSLIDELLIKAKGRNKRGLQQLRKKYGN